MNRGDLHDFVFRGILGTKLIEDLERASLLRPKGATREERRQADLLAGVDSLLRRDAREMQWAYYLLYIFENVVRQLIISVGVEGKGKNWFDEVASMQMKKKMEDRKRSEETNRWHPGRSVGPIFYLDLGDLSDIIVNNWDLFRDLFPNQAWVISRVKEADRTRNVIAHTNTLAIEEVARLEQHLRDWLRQVG